MSIITNFLKLIKPEKNDYVDVEEHISNNYDKIDTWARDLVINDLENGGVDKALSANQGLILDNKDVGIMGGRDGKFPLTAATKGNIYLLESTQKYYICINDYDGIQISVPNANFEELSVYTNRSKLDNLPKIFDFEETLIGNIKFVKYESSNSTSSQFQVTFECKKILHISVLPWNSSLSAQMMSTHLDGNTIKISTSPHGGCKLFAILLV